MQSLLYSALLCFIPKSPEFTLHALDQAEHKDFITHEAFLCVLLAGE